MNNLVDADLAQLSKRVREREENRVSMARKPSIPAAALIILSTFIVLGAEAAILLIGILPGAILDSLLMIGAANLYYFSQESTNRPIFLAFVLVPLMRILSLALPVSQTTLALGYAIVGIPLLLAAVLDARIVGLPSMRLNLTTEEWAVQLLFGICGIPLGNMAFVLFPYLSKLPTFSKSWMSLGVASLMLFSGFTEEFVFRGIVQKALSNRLGAFGVLLSSLLYAGLFLGTRSPELILFYGIIGLIFASWAHKSGSLWGTIIAHSLLNIFLWIILPIH